MRTNEKLAVIDYIRQAAPGRILDIPSGSCWLSEYAGPEAGWEYFAADLYKNSPTCKNFRTADLNKRLPYDDGVFDYVACIEGLEHAENYHHCLREFNRVLKPGGTLLLSTPNPLYITSRLRYMLTGTFYGFPHLINMPEEGGHLHMTPVNLSFLLSFASRYGFGLERIHRMRPKRRALFFLPHALYLKVYSSIKFTFRDPAFKRRLRELVSYNVLMNEVILVSFKKTP